ncbi:hypothetical protein BaRGS_00024703, partial [Batillaria attramentaria]
HVFGVILNNLCLPEIFLILVEQDTDTGMWFLKPTDTFFFEENCKNTNLSAPVTRLTRNCSGVTDAITVVKPNCMRGSLTPSAPLTPEARALSVTSSFRQSLHAWRPEHKKTPLNQPFPARYPVEEANPAFTMSRVQPPCPLFRSSTCKGFHDDSSFLWPWSRAYRVCLKKMTGEESGIQKMKSRLVEFI